MTRKSQGKSNKGESLNERINNSIKHGKPQHNFFFRCKACPIIIFITTSFSFTSANWLYQLIIKKIFKKKNIETKVWVYSINTFFQNSNYKDTVEDEYSLALNHWQDKFFLPDQFFKLSSWLGQSFQIFYKLDPQERIFKPNNYPNQ